MGDSERKTLLQILVDELGEWPEGMGLAVAEVCAVDEREACVRFAEAGAVPEFFPSGWNFTSSNHFEMAESELLEMVEGELPQVPTDWQTAIVYRSDWEEARKATSGDSRQGQPRTAPDFLRAGLAHMEDRAATYDKPDGERSMSATVRAFEAKTGIALTEEQGWLFLGTLKDVRSQQGKYRSDNYEDRAAFAGLQGEAAARERVGSIHPQPGEHHDQR